MLFSNLLNINYKDIESLWTLERVTYYARSVLRKEISFLKME